MDNQNTVLCYFDKDYDERLKTHVDPSRTALMTEPYRSLAVNPYFYCASSFNKNEVSRQEPDTIHLRDLLDLRVKNVAQGLNMIQESYHYKQINKDGSWGNIKHDRLTDSMLPEGFKGEAGDIPALFKSEDDGSIKPTKAFFMLLDRINECAEKEKEQAREIGRKEGLVAGYEVAQKVMLENTNLDMEMKNVKYPDYADKCSGIVVGNVQLPDKINEQYATKTLEDIWAIQDKYNISPNDKVYKM